MGNKKSRKRKAAARRERLMKFLQDLISAVLSGLITAAILKALRW